MRYREKKISFFEYPPSHSCDEFDAKTPRKPAKRYGLLVVIAALAIVAAYAAHATAWDVQNPDGSWSPNPECTGSCPETGIPNPPEPAPEPKQSHEGSMTRINCGCGYMVILRDGQTRAQGLAACRATVSATKECAK